MFLWLKTLYRKRAVTWPFIFYTIIWTLSLAMLIEAAFARNMLSFDELVDKLVTTAKDGVVDARSLFDTDDNSEEDFEGGI